MYTHPEISIALAEGRIAEHHEWAARERLVRSARGSRTRLRSVLLALARRADRPVRPWYGNSFEPQAVPAV